MPSELLDALLAEADEGTITFLLDSLTIFQAEDCDWETQVEPLVESFVENSTNILQILRSDHSAVEEAQAIWKEQQQEQSEHDQDDAEDDATTSDLTRSLKHTPIEGAQNRAISLRQLKEIYAYVTSQAEADGSLPWIDRSEDSPTNGQRLHIQTINLYHLVEFVVIPLTKSQQCSIVEVMASGPQKPRWFVSHAWAEPIHDLVTSVTEHAQVRGLDEDTLYWICGYANNQHKIEEDIKADPKETSFYRALQSSEGMLLCLDSTGTPFQRIWCCFEQAMFVETDDDDKTRRLLLDIATVTKDGKAVVITDGRSYASFDLQEGPKFALEFKRDRESGFPLELLERGYEIDIRSAKAAREEDRRNILKTITGSYGSTGEPNLADPSISKVNKVLRGIFAEAAARKAAEAGRIDAVVRVLHDDTERTVLTLNLGGSQYLELSPLASLAGHPCLRQLTIDCSYGNIENVLGIAECIAGLNCLEKLELKFDWCSTLEDVTSLSEKGLVSLRSLKELRLDFTGCALAVVLPRIEEVHSLERIYINYTGTHSRANGKALSGILQLKDLRVLDLSFSGCRHVEHLSVFKYIGQCSNLQRLSLDCSYTPRLNDLNGLGALVNLEKLKQCKLSFTKCAQITEVPWLHDLVAHGTEIDINFTECKGLDTNLQAHFQSRRDITQALYGGLTSLLPAIFEEGEEIQYFSRRKKLWLPAVIEKVESLEIHLKVKSNGQHFPRKIPAHEISSNNIRRKNGDTVPFKSGPAQILFEVAKETNPMCLLGKFAVGEQVEYFARDWKKKWLQGTVTKVESEAIKIKVPGYNELRRVLAEEIPLKVRRQEKKG